MWAMFKAVLRQFTILLPLFALRVAFSTGDIIYLPIIIRRLHCLMLLCCVYFSKTDFFKKKTKTEAKFGPLSTDDKLSLGHAHTQTHTSTEMLSDENGTKAPCATNIIVYPQQCACKIFEHVIA